MSGHSFEATVEQGGHGSVLKIDGVEVPEVRSFAVDVSLGCSRLRVETISPGSLRGIVDSVVVNSRVWVVSDGDVGPIGVFGKLESAEACRLEWQRRHGDDEDVDIKETTLEL